MNRSRFLGIGSALTLLLTAVLQVSASAAVMNFTLMDEKPKEKFALLAQKQDGKKYTEGNLTLKLEVGDVPKNVQANVNKGTAKAKPKVVLQDLADQLNEKFQTNNEFSGAGFKAEVVNLKSFLEPKWALQIEKNGKVIKPNSIQLPKEEKPLEGAEIPEELNLPTEPLPEPGTCTILAGLGFAALVNRRSRKRKLGFR